MKFKISRAQWEQIGKTAGWGKWYDSSEGPTDPENASGTWKGGWLRGEWKCPNCGTMFGKNLRNQAPFALVEQHKKECKSAKGGKFLVVDNDFNKENYPDLVGKVVENPPGYANVKPVAEANVKTAQAARECACGSGLIRRPLYDARNIFVAYVCDLCEKRIKSRYRDDIFTDPNYWHDEPIDGD